MTKKDVIAPRSLKQKMFIDSDADITIFGGKVVPPCFV